MSMKKGKECIRIQFNVTNKGTKFEAFFYKYDYIVTFVPLCTACVMSSVYTRKLHKHPLQARWQNCGKRLSARSWLSVRPHVTTRLPLDGFS
jgi:hypothetical protein